VRRTHGDCGEAAGGGGGGGRREGEGERPQR
jgi:hypothetical protein